MNLVLFYLSFLAAVAVFIVLTLGLLSMMKNKSPNLSQKLMRWRVALQFVALLVLMGFVYVAG